MAAGQTVLAREEERGGGGWVRDSGYGTVEEAEEEEGEEGEDEGGAVHDC